MPSEAGESSSSDGVARMRSSASAARSKQRVDRGPERVEPEGLDRQPDLERAPAARELEPEVGEVDLAVLDLGVLEVVGHDLERAAQQPSVAHEEAAALHRLVEPLVRVERDRVRRLDAGQRRAAALGEHREPAVRGVDVQPHAVAAADVGQRAERIDGTGVGRTGGDRREQRRAALGDVDLDRPLEPPRVEPPVRACGEHTQLLGPEAEQARRARQRRVRLVGHVGDDALVHRAEQRLARARERGHVGRRAAAEQDPRRVGRIAEPVLEPVEHGQLDLTRPRRLHPRADVDVERAGDEVAERARKRLARRHEREEPRMVGAVHVREHVGRQAPEHVGHLLRRVRRRAGQALGHLARGRAP